ncbi:haloacid dehalogenase, partial [Saccharopolyspora elongata]
MNAPSERVVVQLASTPPPLQDLIRLVVRAESRAAAAEAEYGEWCPEPHHPSEEARQRQSLPALAADGVGLLISAITRLSPWTPLPAEVGALATAIQLHPKLRGFVGKGLRGREQTESVLPVISALAQGVATRGGGLVLDVAERLSQWREADADRNAWAAAEPRLVRGPEDAAAEPIVVERPGPAHRDIIARHTEQAMAVGASCGAAVGPFAGPRRGLAVALASEPKAPDAGREGFATSLGRFLARRGAIAMDRGALRRLGQVDTVVLDEDALRGDRYELADLVPLAGTEPETITERLFELFHPSEPDQLHRNADGWVLGPLEDLDLTGCTGQQAAGRLRRSSDRVLGLARGHRLQAVAGVVAQTMPGVQALTAAARRSGVRLVLATDHSDSAFGFVDAVMHSGRRLMASVHHLQADGAVVLLVSGNRGALGASDCGIGVYRDGEAPAWGADILVGPNLEAAAVIVDGIGTARRVDQDSSLLAAGGSGVGAIAALQAPPAQACARGQAAGNTAGGIAFCLGLWRARQLLSHPITPPG